MTLATVVLAPEPMTRYALAHMVEARFGSGTGGLRTRFQHSFDTFPALERAGLIRGVGTGPPRGARLWAATAAGVEDWRAWLTQPITMPNAMTAALARLKAARRGDYATMLAIIDRYEALLQQIVEKADYPGEPEDIADRVGLLWNRRELVAQLQWCQHARDHIQDEVSRGNRR